MYCCLFDDYMINSFYLIPKIFSVIEKYHSKMKAGEGTKRSWDVARKEHIL